MKPEKRQLEAITEIKDGQMTAVASTEGEDRVGDALKVKDWNLANFKKNPVLQAGHDYRPQFTIGIAKNLRAEGKKLIFEPIFHGLTKLSSDIRAMFEEGYLKAWSVGFIPAKEEGQKNELLEVSAVAVPANAEALTLIKSMEGLDEKEEREITEKVTKWVEEKGCCGDGENESDVLGKAPDSEGTEEDAEPDKEETGEPAEMEEEKEEQEETEPVEKEVVEKPYKNEHACRLNDPGKYDNFRSGSRTHNGKKYRVIFGIKDGKSEQQAYRYQKDIWTASEAKSHCKDHGGKFEAAKKEKVTAGEAAKNIMKSMGESYGEEYQDDFITEIICQLMALSGMAPQRKEGRIISQKNRTTITKTINLLNESVVALEKLLELSEPSGGGEKNQIPVKPKINDKKGREPKKVDRYSTMVVDEVALRTLQKINKLSNHGLNKLKK